MKKQISLLLLSFLMTSALMAQQTLLGYFSFPTQTETPGTPTSFSADGGAQSGTAKIFLDGTNGSSSWTQNGELNMFTGNTTNTISGGEATYDLALVNQSANGKSMVFKFSTTGYQSIVISFATRGSGTGFNNHAWLYSTDGTVFTPISGNNTANTTSTVALKTLDLTGITAINNQSNVYIKLTVTGAGSASGNNRFDNIQINASPLGPDVTPPKITDDEVVSANSIVLTFNEALNSTIAQTASKYVINNGITVSSASLATSVVTLTPNPALTEGTTYTITVKDIQDLAGNIMPDSTFNFTFGVPSTNWVANVGELKTKIVLNPDEVTAGTTEYKITGEVVVTALGSQRGQKWIQDATGAVLIDDPNGKITTTLQVGDKVKDIYGTVTNYYGLLELVATKNIPSIISSFNDVTPLAVTMDNIKDASYMVDHQSELMQLSGVTFTDANGTNEFENGKKYRLNPGTTADSLIYTSIYNVDYINTTIPSGSKNITGISTFTRGKYYITPRGTYDFSSGTGIKELEAENIYLYPNPVVGDYFVVESATSIDVKIYNTQGMLLQQAQYEAGTNIIKKDNLVAGLYTVKVTDQATQATKKFKLLVK